MNNGQAMALRIVTANKLGFEVGYNEEARKMLENPAYTPPPCLIGRISGEANQAVILIEKDKKQSEAQAIAEELADTYNIED